MHSVATPHRPTDWKAAVPTLALGLCSPPVQSRLLPWRGRAKPPLPPLPPPLEGDMVERPEPAPPPLPLPLTDDPGRTSRCDGADLRLAGGGVARLMLEVSASIERETSEGPGLASASAGGGPGGSRY